MSQSLTAPGLDACHWISRVEDPELPVRASPLGILLATPSVLDISRACAAQALLTRQGVDESRDRWLMEQRSSDQPHSRTHHIHAWQEGVAGLSICSVTGVARSCHAGTLS
eukprot:TRINITY_DN4211_c0_g1_i1.p2 TRINITY_DN4211_c0_g1~~TRINITY_DN4211_c0_g1_i1.p2  ORF type:complete len:111 (-),score=5.81 TRINITY_DN4211_c0_g1_i1:623-955(-)